MNGNFTGLVPPVMNAPAMLKTELHLLSANVEDEVSSDGLALVEVQRSVKRTRERRLSQLGANVGRVACLDRQDTAGSSEVALVHDGGSSAEISKVQSMTGSVQRQLDRQLALTRKLLRPPKRLRE